MTFIEVINESKIYQSGQEKIYANDQVNFEIEKGELAVILGSSGAGKSTVLNILGGMDTNDEGEVIIDEEKISNFSNKELITYRRYAVGFVFQFYNLVNNLTALENVELASEIVENALDAKEVLKSVGLEHRLHNFPSQLSGGEQQRVAIARAIAKNPKILLCDEPTGALDYHTGKQILKIFKIWPEKKEKQLLLSRIMLQLLQLPTVSFKCMMEKLNKLIIIANQKILIELSGKLCEKKL